MVTFLHEYKNIHTFWLINKIFEGRGFSLKRTRFRYVFCTRGSGLTKVNFVSMTVVYIKLWRSWFCRYVRGVLPVVSTVCSLGSILLSSRNALNTWTVPLDLHCFAMQIQGKHLDDRGVVARGFCLSNSTWIEEAIDSILDVLIKAKLPLRYTYANQFCLIATLPTSFKSSNIVRQWQYVYDVNLWTIEIVYAWIKPFNFLQSTSLFFFSNFLIRNLD